MRKGIFAIFGIICNIQRVREYEINVKTLDYFTIS